jgi:hypothetical protein
MGRLRIGNRSRVNLTLPRTTKESIEELALSSGRSLSDCFQEAAELLLRRQSAKLGPGEVTHDTRFGAIEDEHGNIDGTQGVSGEDPAAEMLSQVRRRFREASSPDDVFASCFRATALFQFLETLPPEDLQKISTLHIHHIGARAAEKMIRMGFLPREWKVLLNACLLNIQTAFGLKVKMYPGEALPDLHGMIYRDVGFCGRFRFDPPAHNSRITIDVTSLQPMEIGSDDHRTFMSLFGMTVD